LTVASKERTPAEAIKALGGLRDKYGGRPRGKGGLTLPVIAKQVGVKNPVTIGRWFSDGENRHEPWGDVLRKLNKFLDKCENKDWLLELIEPKPKKAK
jgi:hypothetical protein